MGRTRVYEATTCRLLMERRTRWEAELAADRYALDAVRKARGWVIVDLVLVEEVSGEIVVSSELKQVGPPDDLDGCWAWLLSLRRHHA